MPERDGRGGIRVTRQGTDWSLVISALINVVGGNDDLIARIRSAVIPAGPSAFVSIDVHGQQGGALRSAVRFADQGRPEHFPPVSIEELALEAENDPVS